VTLEPGRTRTLAELALRVLLALLVVDVFPYIFQGDVGHFWHVGQRLGWHHLPYRGLFWEFPPLTALWLLPARALSFGAYRLLFVASMIACEWGSLALLRRAHPHLDRQLTVWWTACALPLATVAWFRFDFLPVLAATAAIVAIGRGRSGTGGVVVGVAAKLWPGVAAATHLVERRWRALAANVAGSVALLAAWWAWSPGGMDRWLGFRRGSGLQLESLPASIVRPFAGGSVSVVSGAFVVGGGGWTWVEQVCDVLLVVVAAVVVVRAYRRGGDPIALTGALVTATMLCSRILSPQYLVWLAPFVVVLAARGRTRPAQLLAVAGVLTTLLVWRYAELVVGSSSAQILLLVRNGLLVALEVELVRAIRPANVRSDGLPAPGRLPTWPTSSSSAERVSTT
jgi:hypothetical protein